VEQEVSLRDNAKTPNRIAGGPPGCASLFFDISFLSLWLLLTILPGFASNFDRVRRFGNWF
jgi:hypothetical protein